MKIRNCIEIWCINQRWGLTMIHTSLCVVRHVASCRVVLCRALPCKICVSLGLDLFVDRKLNSDDKNYCAIQFVDR